VTDTRVLIVDDDEDMRALLSSLIYLTNEGLSVVAEAADADEALRRWREEQPEVVVLDQQMPGMSGIETAERMLIENPTQTILLFTAYPDAALLAAADRIGVRECVPKSEVRQLVKHLRACVV
jgi:DNA-binding NarL/FixJ family response regulator